MKTRHQAEQANPHQHVQPAGVFADHGFHGLGQRIVDVGQGAPVANATGKEHYAHCQQHQGQDAADVGLGNRALGVLGFFGGHGCALDGEEEPDGERDGGKHAGDGRGAEYIRTGPAIECEVAEAERRCDHPHEHQQLGNGQHADDQLKSRGQFHPEDVQPHEHDVGTHRRMLGIERRELHVKVSANRQGNGRWGEDEFDQRRQPGDQSAFFAEGPAAVGKRPTGVGNRGGQLGEAEDEAGVHGGDHEGSHQKPQRPGDAPAVTPAEILSGNHQPDRNAPQVQSTQRGFKLCVHAFAP